ncbi:MAG: hypothetical protein K8S00_06820, partial [Bacteroidales bacterium]|nr:hypothetical protein [Bacteroidales bacterium]
MKNVFKLAILSLSLSLILFSCSGKKTIKLIETNFSDEISQHQELDFIFNIDIVPDSIINIWDTIQYIEFEPEVKGKFMWTYPNQLVFSPEEAYKPSTEYIAKLT